MEFSCRRALPIPRYRGSCSDIRYYFQPLISFLESLGSKGEHTQQEIAEAIVFRLTTDINSPIQMYAQVHCWYFSFQLKVIQEIISERMKKISCVESIIQRFLHSDPEMEAIYKDVVCIRRMQVIELMGSNFMLFTGDLQEVGDV